MENVSENECPDAMVIDSNTIEPPQSKLCTLLEEVPREIRDKIWRFLLLKPVAIRPEVRTHEYRWTTGNHNEEHKHCRYDRKYHHDWAQLSDDYSDPVAHLFGADEGHYSKYHVRFRSQVVRGEVSWTTNPTREQLRLIENGVNHFEIDDSPEPGQQTKCVVHHRPWFGPQIINRAEVQLHPFGRSVNIMRTCKQVEEECAAILYGENTYQFVLRFSHESDELKEWGIPSFRLFKEGSSSEEVTWAVNWLFDVNYEQPQLISSDPFIRFIVYIGRRNASLLRDIQFDGMFKSQVARDYNSWLGFGTLLPMYTLIIGQVCPGLCKLTLHQCDERNDWSADLKKDDAISDEDMIDSIIAKLAVGLPYLRDLQLGAYPKIPVLPDPNADPNDVDYFHNPDRRNEWGMSLRWMKFVKERSNQQPNVNTSESILTRTRRSRDIEIRSGGGSRYKYDWTEHRRRGSYGTSNRISTYTICPTKTIPSRQGLGTMGNGDVATNMYGSLPREKNTAWRCRDAHGGYRYYNGRIENISDEVDRESIPYTVAREKFGKRQFDRNDRTT